jgi:hypothetical protein
VTCPRCGSVSGPGSEYCVDCGQPLRAPGTPRAFRGKHSGGVWTVLAVLVLAALGALIAIAVSRGDDGGTQTVVATRLPARTTVTTVPVFGTGPTVTTALPVVTATTPLPTAPGTTTLTKWSVADGYTLVLASVPNANGRASAVQIARRALDQGLPDVGILDSSMFSGLQPGFFVVFTGVYTSNADASARLQEAKTAGFTAAYVRRITR